MTAFDLVAEIFARPQQGVASNVRFVTLKQLRYLLDLIGADPEGGALGPAGPGRWMWTPMGRNKYEITEDVRGGNRHSIRRLANLGASGTGQLF